MLKIEFASILRGDVKRIGTKILSYEGVSQVVNDVVSGSILRKDSLLKEGRAQGQYIADLDGRHLEAILPHISCGDGRHTGNPDDYVVRKHWSGKVMMCLKRALAEPCKQVRLIIDTREAYLADPDVIKDPAETARIRDAHPDFVVVWIVAAAASTEMPGSTFLRNLAGANNEAMKMTADEIRAQASKSQAHDETWCVVAD